MLKTDINEITKENCKVILQGEKQVWKIFLTRRKKRKLTRKKL